MLIPCPFCGERDNGEFVVRAEAREAPALDASSEAHNAYLFARVSPRGVTHEYWYHAQGCRSWLIVVRDLRTHAIKSAKLAKAP